VIVPNNEGGRGSANLASHRGESESKVSTRMEVVVPVSLAGLRSVTVPAGFSSNGLPIGVVQLAASRGQDAKLLRLAQAYYEAVDWLPKQPAVVHDVSVGARCRVFGRSSSVVSTSNSTSTSTD
jgi:hypothetical protein